MICDIYKLYIINICDTVYVQDSDFQLPKKA